MLDINILLLIIKEFNVINMRATITPIFMPNIYLLYTVIF